jgi:hypothetical protein
MFQTSVEEMTKKCGNNDDCPRGELCISPSYYGGSKTGYCMNSNEPGIPRRVMDHADDLMQWGREGFRQGSQAPRPPQRMSRDPTHVVRSSGNFPSSGGRWAGIEYSRRPETCTPSDFFNFETSECESRFQGVSSARAVWSVARPDEPVVTIPGSSTFDYGVGWTDPNNVMTRTRLAINDYGPPRL